MFLRYGAIFLGALLEGPAVMIGAGLLLKQGYFHLLPAFLMLFLGDLTGDLAWYGVGYGALLGRLGTRRRFFPVPDGAVQRVERAFLGHHGKILLLSKVTMGLGAGVAVLVTAGMVRMPLKRYTLYNALGGTLWTGLLMGAGYVSGRPSLMVERGLEGACLPVAAAVLLVALGSLGHRAARKLGRTSQ
jgi:membrane protein DedA with SNARE-associated domain